MRTARTVQLAAVSAALLVACCAYGGEVVIGKLPDRAKGTVVSVSPDGRHLAYIRQDSWHMRAVVDGRAHPPYDWVVDGLVAFSRDSQHTIYRIRLGGQTRMILDGLEQKLCDEIGEWACSASGGKLAYSVRRGEKWCVIADGFESKLYPNVRVCGVGPKGPIYVGIYEKGERLAIGLAEGPMYDRIADVRIGPDERRIAYRAMKDAKWRMVIDGAEGPAFEQVGPAIFSADGQRVGYEARRGSSRVFVLDGREIPAAGLLGAALVDAGARLACVQTVGAKQRLVIDGKPGPLFDSVGPVLFSADGRRAAYVGRNESGCAMVVDGAEGAGFDEISTQTMAFSANGRHFGFVGRRGSKWVAVVDSAESSAYDSILNNAPLVFDGDAVNVIGVRGEEYVKVKVAAGNQ